MLRTELAALQETVQEQAAALVQIDPAGARLVAMQSAAPSPGGTGGRIVFQPDGQTAVVVLEHLPPLPAGRVYQLWLLQGTSPVSAGTFVPGDSGAASVVVRAPGRLSGFSGFGLTAEPAPGSPAPTGQILARAAL